jgi:hypothetical protein
MFRVATAVRAFAPAALVGLSAGSGHAQQTVTPTQHWDGEFGDEKLKQAVPKGGVIADADGFAKLWKAWRPNEAAPGVDFDKQFVVVATCVTKGEHPVSWATLRAGVLGVNWDGARRGRGGWGYDILAFDRAGVNEVNGLKLAPPKGKPAGRGK